MLKADVIIIGAGPAGSIAAQRIARRGLSVILLEQDIFPRSKCCGDGLTSQGLDVLHRSGLDGWAEQFPLITQLRFSSPNQQILDITFDQAPKERIGRIIPRAKLDEKLAQKAVDAGAHLYEKVKVLRVGIQKDFVEVGASDLNVQGKLLILAEGSNAVLTRRLNLLKGTPELLACRQYLKEDAGPQNRLEIHFESTIIPGYNWMFPMGNGEVNVGSGTYLKRAKDPAFNLREELRGFIQSDPVLQGRLKNAKPVADIQTAPLRTHIRATRTHAERVLVVGDAAGLVNPLTGVGIAQAMHSGELAAKYVVLSAKKNDYSARILQNYTGALRGEYQTDQYAARFLRSLLSHPDLLNKVFQRLSTKPELALLFGEIFLAKKSSREALRPAVLMEMLSR